MKNSLVLKDTVKSAYELADDSESFIITAKKGNFLSIDDNNIKKIMEYTSSDANNIVELYELTRERCVSKFYSDLMPLMIISKNNFYDTEVFLERSKLYKTFIGDLDRVSILYNRIVDSHISFIKNTGYYFQDMSGNNILIDSKYDKFRIIDVFSLKKYTGQLIKFDPPSIIMATYIRIYKWKLRDEAMKSFLSEIDLKKIKDTIFSKIKTRTFNGGKR